MNTIKRLKTIVLIFTLLITLSNCLSTEHKYNVKPVQIPQNQMRVNILFDTIKPGIHIDFNINSDREIKSLELTNGIIQMKNIENNRNYIFEIESKVYDIMYTSNDNENNYKFNLSKYVDKDIIEEIKEYNNYSLKILLEYNIIIDDEINYGILDEEFDFEISEYKITIFHFIAFFILGGLGILRL